MKMSGEHIMDMVIESIIHAGHETIKTFPFLFAAFMIMELVEYHGRDPVAKVDAEIQNKPVGYFIGAMAGCIPQCGFAAAAANLWAGGRVSTGMLVTVFISTSDEALLLLLSDPDHIKDACYILLIKITIGIAAGYTVDHIMPAGKISISFCSRHHCYGATLQDVIISALVHTLKMLAILLFFLASVNFIIHTLGENTIGTLLMAGTVFQPIIAALVGMIPSCIPSVLITQLYIEGLVSFPALLAGLTANAGVGLMIARSVPVAVILFITALTASFAIQFLPLP